MHPKDQGGSSSVAPPRGICRTKSRGGPCSGRARWPRELARICRASSRLAHPARRCIMRDGSRARGRACRGVGGGAAQAAGRADLLAQAARSLRDAGTGADLGYRRVNGEQGHGLRIYAGKEAGWQQRPGPSTPTPATCAVPRRHAMSSPDWSRSPSVRVTASSFGVRAPRDLPVTYAWRASSARSPNSSPL